jgi:hypothetical protein
VNESGVPPYDVEVVNQEKPIPSFPLGSKRKRIIKGAAKPLRIATF